MNQATKEKKISINFKLILLMIDGNQHAYGMQISTTLFCMLRNL